MSLLLILVSGMVLIVLSADYFTNGIEWMGYVLGMDEGAVGSLLAALGTALPETLVPIMAMAFGANQVNDAIGLGAILGAPLMLATLAFMIIGIGLWSNGRVQPRLDPGPIERDLRFFLGGFGLAVAAGFLPEVWHKPIAAALVLAYVVHAWRLLHHNTTKAEPAPPAERLHLSFRPIPRRAMVFLQVAMALLGLILGAHFFVVALDRASSFLKMSGFLLSVIITPVATELPEVLNSVLWIRRDKDTLAFGNVTGAMAFQATVVPALGMALTSWRLNGWELAAALLGWSSAAFVFWQNRRTRIKRGPLMLAGIFYLAFIALVIATA
ncbi:MAG: sodium:calcium antiporter [Sulfobacillus sp.]